MPEETYVLSCQLACSVENKKIILDKIRDMVDNGTLVGADIVVYSIEQNPELYTGKSLLKDQTIT